MKTDIHLVGSLTEAYGVMHNLGAQAAGLDLEGMIGNYVGNDVYPGRLEDFRGGDATANIALTQTVVRNSPEVYFATMTNNTNEGDPDIEEPGIVTWSAETLGIALIHKGMQARGVALGKKPKGDQGRHLSELSGVAPDKTVLIDDQGVKNAGEAVKAGFMAIIVPNPIGLPLPHRGMVGDVVEHNGVRRARTIEPLIYRSLARKGFLAMAAYDLIAKTNIDDIGRLYDHRKSN